MSRKYAPEWPPKDRLIRDLQEIVDASPRSEWMTSGERVRASERLVEELRRRGWTIVRQRDAEPSA